MTVRFHGVSAISQGLTGTAGGGSIGADRN